MTTTHDPVREALRAKLERAKAAFNSDEFASDSIRLSFSEIEQLLATPARPRAGDAVPGREPTQAMIDAAAELQGYDGRRNAVTLASNIWRVMWDAANPTEAAPATAVDPAREALTAEQEIAIREGLEAAAILIWGPHFAYSSDDERVFSQGFRSGWGAREHPRTVARLPLSTTKD